MPKRISKAYIGTSGWFYPEWIGKIYPGTLKRTDAFSFYLKEFNTVELNASFYHFPQKKTVENWHAAGDNDFVWAVKAWRWLTHTKRLKNVTRDTRDFFNRVHPLLENKGVLLFQTPPSMKQDLTRLRSFLSKSAPNCRKAIEFRHNSWFVPETYEILREFGTALVGVDAPGIQRVLDVRTASFAYFRLHGTDRWYSHNYTAKQLDVFEKAARAHLCQGDFYMYFDNTASGDAFHNAQEMRDRLQK